MYSVLVIGEYHISEIRLERILMGINEVKLIGVVGTLREGLTKIEQLSPSLVITDLYLSDSRGLDTVRSIVAAQKRRHVAVLSSYDETVYADQVLKLGARGYLMTDYARDFLQEAICAIAVGGIWVSREVTQIFMRRLHSKNGVNEHDIVPRKLTPRESQVIELLGQGLTTKELARLLRISIRTVDLHRRAIKSKLGFRTSSEMIAFAAAQKYAK